MSLSQKVAFNTGIQIVSKIITVGFTLLTTILLTGYLGKQGYGEYIYVITLVALFGSFADWGTLTIGVREVAKKKQNQGQLLANIFVLRLLLSFLAIALLIIASFFLPMQRRMIIIASPILFWVATKASFGIVFQTKLQMYKAAIADIVNSFLIFVFSWYVVQKGLGFGPLIWSVTWATVLAALAAGVLAIKTVNYIFALDKKLITRFFKESLPMGAVLLMFTMDNKIDTVMLGSFKGSGAVGIYGLSSRVYDVLVLGAAYLMNSLLPIISSLNKPKMRIVYQKTFKIMLAMGLAVLAGVMVFSPLIIKILTQQRFVEFFDSVAILKIMGVSLLIAYFNHLTGYTIVALGKQRWYFRIALISLVFNLVANLIFIPRFSYFGAAWVTVLTESLVLAITIYYLRWTLKS